jgi:hypothetical protein
MLVQKTMRIKFWEAHVHALADRYNGNRTYFERPRQGHPPGQQSLKRASFQMVHTQELHEKRQIIIGGIKTIGLDYHNLLL